MSRQQLPIGWTWVTVGDVAEYINGLAFKPTDWEDKGRPIIRIQNLTDPTKPYNRTTRKAPESVLVKFDDILVSWSATLDAFLWKGPDAVLNQHIFRVIPRDHIVRRKYLFWALKHLIQQMWASEHTHGSTMKHINRGPFLAHPFPLAPFQEQQRIVDEVERQLTRLDAGVGTLKRVQIQLKRYRASILKAACEGRLVPTEAELARREKRDYEPADKLLARILKERRARWEVDQLAKMKEAGKLPKDDKWKAKYIEPDGPTEALKTQLPEGWAWTTIGQAFRVGVGATPSRAKPSFWTGPIAWVSSGEVSFCRIRTTRETITEEGLANSSTEIHPKGTVLLGMIGEGRTRGQVAILEIAACNNQNSAAIRVSEAGLPPEYVYRYLEGQYEQTRRVGSGNNQPALNKSRVEVMPIPLPPLAEQHRIALEVERLLSNADNIESLVAANVARSNKMRQSILRSAFAGLLVPQDLREQPSSKLLERISASMENKPLLTQGRAKQTTVVPKMKKATQ